MIGSKSIQLLTPTKDIALQLTDRVVSGSFGTVLANMVASNGYLVRLWLRDQKLALIIENDRVNKRYLPGFTLDSSLHVTTCLKTCLSDADTVFLLYLVRYYVVFCIAYRNLFYRTSI